MAPRKKRTRQHVIAEISVHHVEGFILEAGHTAQRLGSDYGYDLLMNTFDRRGYAEPGTVYFQVKAMEKLKESRSDYLYDLDIRDYNLWIREKMPVILILFDASKRRACWLAVQQYFALNTAPRPKQGARTIRIRVSKRQVVNERAIAEIRELKRVAIHQAEWGEQ
jgi:hypothetical protein